MTYIRQGWVDGVAGNTPTSAARFNWMEAGIQDASDRLDTLTKHPVVNGGGVPTATALAGTSPPTVLVAAASKDARGSLTFGTGTTPAAGNVVTVTFNSTWGTAPFVVITPLNAATAALNDYISSVTATAFTIGVASAPAASQGNTVYSFAWQVVG